MSATGDEWPLVTSSQWRWRMPSVAHAACLGFVTKMGIVEKKTITLVGNFLEIRKTQILNLNRLELLRRCLHLYIFPTYFVSYGLSVLTSTTKKLSWVIFKIKFVWSAVRNWLVEVLLIDGSAKAAAVVNPLRVPSRFFSNRDRFVRSQGLLDSIEIEFLYILTLYLEIV